ncbi:MAG: hypothetical protein AB1679_26375 [Actinomycetota bacterium]
MRKPEKAGRIAVVVAIVALAGGGVLTGSGVGRAGAAGEAASYEAVASAEGVRFSMSAPNFVAVETFIDGGGPVSQAVIDGLGNSHAFASLPYPGDLAISGPGLLAGLTGLPSPPPYPFYVNSSYPTKPEGKLAQPGYELTATSGEASSESSAITGGASGDSAVGRTVTRSLANRDPATGAVTAQATGTADVINIGGVLRIGQVDALARVTRSPGQEPVRQAAFTINGVTIAGQTVGFSDKGFTLAGTTTPIPAGNPLTEALKQAKINVQYIARVDNPDGVVSPGLVITQEQQMPSGPMVVLRYVFGRMAASATLSGSSTSIGSDLPVGSTGPAEPVVEGGSSPTPELPPPSTPSFVSDTPMTDFDSGTVADTSTGYGFATTDLSVPPVTDTGGEAVADTPAPSPSPGGEVQLATPIAQQPAMRVDTLSIYVILVVGALVALAGGLLLRLVGVKLKWVS